MRRDRSRGFTLLEIMVTIALVGGSLVMILSLREHAQVAMFEARNANLARTLARELLSEIEFRDPGMKKDGGFDGYPGFTYRFDQYEEVDLVTGEEAEDEDGDGFTKDDRNSRKNRNKGKNSSGSAFTPGDRVDPDEEELEYPVRRVKLTIEYPNLSGSGDDASKPRQLVIETILPALPKDDSVTDLTKTGKNSDKK